MKRVAILIYGIIAYCLFFTTFLYLIGFTGDLFVPKTVDGQLTVPLWQAVLTNLSLIVLFGLQHSIMARSWFKKWWTQFVPEVMERSTYLIFTCIVLILMFVFWQPMGGQIWKIENEILGGILLALFTLGWITVLVSSFLINHFDLFGLRQVWFYFKKQPYTPLPFDTPLLYKMVRHPLYLGLLLGFWCAPSMTVTRLFFAIGLSIYIFLAIQWEEKDLLIHFGEKYRQYMKNVPMIFPSFFRRKNKKPVYETIIKGRETQTDV